MLPPSPQCDIERSAMALTVREVASKKDLEAFLHIPWKLGMKNDPMWVPPLLDDYRRMLDPKKRLPAVKTLRKTHRARSSALRVAVSATL